MKLYTAYAAASTIAIAFTSNLGILPSVEFFSRYAPGRKRREKRREEKKRGQTDTIVDVDCISNNRAESAGEARARSARYFFKF